MSYMLHMKKCGKCQTLKNDDEFSLCQFKRSGGRCRFCCTQSIGEYKNKNPEKIKKHRDKHYKNNHSKIINNKKEKYQKNKEKNIAKSKTI